MSQRQISELSDVDIRELYLIPYRDRLDGKGPTEQLIDRLEEEGKSKEEIQAAVDRLRFGEE